MAETLCTLFARALDRDDFGPDENFFEYGGQSVSAMLLVSRIGEELGAEVALSELFEAPTPNRLAQRLGITADGPLERAQARGAAAEPGVTRGTPGRRPPRRRPTLCRCRRARTSSA
ncbi:acyl carrier protein [Actinacidiphila sp. DG2A-62]|uniref:acyl carrier protein n=1 Tax=Actinacidiphila sp. DG2A-62 TaxID=3108821 RepID=UPI002DBDFDFF|nr:acyl carrier protein [Actinacidiphila sp. DG2A-62]MEC3992624.1 acyl carrier protein [Actinacidiphila sp. DG2A-62]